MYTAFNKNTTGLNQPWRNFAADAQKLAPCMVILFFSFFFLSHQTLVEESLKIRVLILRQHVPLMQPAKVKMYLVWCPTSQTKSAIHYTESYCDVMTGSLIIGSIRFCLKHLSKSGYSCIMVKVLSRFQNIATRIFLPLWAYTLEHTSYHGTDS